VGGVEWMEMRLECGFFWGFKELVGKERTRKRIDLLIWISREIAYWTGRLSICGKRIVCALV
jgi:hypothetical protein